MQHLITSYLLQSGEAVLPWIGSLTITSKPAVIDRINNRILPPENEYSFTENSLDLSPALVKYIARQKNISADLAEDEVKTFCKNWKQKIDSGDKLYFETLGFLQKNEEGIIFFQENKSAKYFKPVNAAVLVKEETKILKTEYDLETTAVIDESANTEIRETRQVWLQWAIILCAVAFVTLFFHFYGQRSSAASAGNQSHFFVTVPDSTYFIPEK